MILAIHLISLKIYSIVYVNIYEYIWIYMNICEYMWIYMWHINNMWCICCICGTSVTRQTRTLWGVPGVPGVPPAAKTSDVPSHCAPHIASFLSPDFYRFLPFFTSFFKLLFLPLFYAILRLSHFSPSRSYANSPQAHGFLWLKQLFVRGFGRKNIGFVQTTAYV